MRQITCGILVLVCGCVLAACGDEGFDLSPLLVSDTFDLAAPTFPANEGLPTALDIKGDGLGGIFGGRFPERPAHALEWDFLVRVREGQVVLVPPGAVGVSSRASITRALPGETLEGLREAPGQSTFIADSAVALQQGGVYVARSRASVDQFGGECSQYAKLSPLEVNAATGRTRIAITTNERCSDPRLVDE